MANPTITSLAILKVNYDQRGQDFIDNFVPFVVDVLRSHGRVGATQAAVGQELRTDFGIAIPHGAVGSVLRRAVKRRLATNLGNGRFVLSDQGEQSPGLADARRAAVRAEEALIERLVKFSGSHTSTPWSPQEAEAALIRFATERGASVLADRGGLVDIAPAGEVRDESHIMAEFAIQLSQRDTDGFDHLETLIKGALLASALYYPDIGRIQSKFERLEVYLDTRVALRALGTAGPEHEAAARELLELLYELGASLRLFDNTLLEVRGVLAAASRALQHPGGLREGSGETLEYLASTGARASDVELLIAQIERRLANLRVTVRQRPAYAASLSIDEARFEQLLRSGRGTHRPYPEDALRHDVAAVTAIHRLRRGQAQPVLETAGAVFLTTNALLCSVTTEFFRDLQGAVAVPLCYEDYQLATLAWLKKPTAAPSLPRLFVIADAFAALNPPNGLWRSYLAEISRLEAQGDLTEEDYYSLRFTMAAKTALIDVTAGGGSVEATVPEVLRRTRAALRAEVEAEYRVSRPVVSDAEAVPKDEVSTLRSQWESERRRRAAEIDSISNAVGRLVARVVFIPLTLICALVAYLSAAPFLPPITVPGSVAWGPLVYLAGLAILAIAVANVVFGTNVRAFSRDIELRVAHKVKALLAQRFS